MKKKGIILVISRREPLPEDVITRMMNFEHVLYIYDYGCNPSWRKWWSPMDPYAYEETLDHTLPSNFLKKPATDLDATAVNFIIKRLLIRQIVTLPATEQARADFINYCREKFASNQIYLNEIKRFEDEYVPAKAVWWYTKPSFVFRAVRLACSSDELVSLFKVRYFISHLYSRLKELYKEQRVGFDYLDILSLWRGRPCTKENLDYIKRNENNLFITDSFTSASFDQKVAYTYAGSEKKLPNNKISMIYLLEIDPLITLSNPIAHVQKESFIEGDDEVLLPIEFFFSVSSVQQVQVVLKTSFCCKIAKGLI